MRRRGKNGNPLKCAIERCFDDVVSLGLCGMHYQREWHQRQNHKTRERFDRSGPCAVEGCDKPQASLGLCRVHYGRQRVYGDPLHVPPSRQRERIIPAEMGPAKLAQVLGVSRQRADQLLQPDKHKARTLVADALRAGRLVKPSRCQRCSAKSENLHAHHWDYHPDAALDVRWLCSKCHGEVHVYLRQIGQRAAYQRA